MRRKLLIASITVVLTLAVTFGVRYRLYAFTIIWHCFHQNTEEIGGHRLKFPILWWQEKNEDYDTFSFERASPSNTFPNPEIVVRPALSGVIPDTNQQVLKSIQILIAARNSHPVPGTSSSLIILNANSFSLYCEKIDTKIVGMDAANTLFCETARVPYIFTYDGPPNYEQEAESILLTLE